MMANEVMGALGLRYWLDCGSLLGAVREGAILDHDLDVDFSCKDWQRHEEIAAAMEEAGFDLVRTHGEPEHGYQQAFRLGRIKVDVFFFYEGTRHGPQDGTCWQGSWSKDELIESRFSSSIVERTVPLAFAGVTVPVPVGYEQLLTARYGDWKVPVLSWDWRTDPRCIVRDYSLADVTVVIKTFMRPHLATRAVRSVRATYPECSVIVIDDSDAPASLDVDLKALGAELVRLPFDSGLSAGRNAGVARVKTPVTLIMDDDMFVSEKTNLPTMLKLLEQADLVCGSMRQDGSIIHWEGFHDLTPDGGLVLRQLRSKAYKQAHGVRVADVDFGLNGFVARTDLLRDHPWDERLKLGEHTDFFLALRGKATIRFTPDAIFGHEREMTKTYRQMRRRKEFRLLFFHKYSLRYHVGASGKRDEWTELDQRNLDRLLRSGLLDEGRPSMALETKSTDNNKKQKMVTVQHRTYLDKRGKATRRVRDAVSLFAIAGQQITAEEASRIGLTGTAPAKAETTSSDSGGIIDLKRANKATLEAEAEKRNLDKTGTNKEIRERIEAHDKAEAEKGTGQ